MSDRYWSARKTANHRPVVQRARWQRLAVAILLAGVVLLLFSSIVLAHAAFVRSEPAPNSVLPDPPGAVTIWFTEPVEPRLSEISVLDATGRSVSSEAATLLPGDPKVLTVPLPRLPDGTYTVAWKNFSTVDGHPTSGSFIFSVGISPQAAYTPPPVAGPPVLPSPAEPVLRWLGLLSILAIVGGLVFELTISWPVLAASATQTIQSMARQMNSRTFKLVWIAAGIFAAVSIGEMLFRSSAAHGIPLFRAVGSPIGSVLQTGWGSLWLWRMNILLGMFAVFVLASLDRRKRRESGGREWQIVALALGAGILFTFSLSSHGAATTEIRTAAIFSDYLHLLAASVWVGGIFYLALVAPPAMRWWRQQNSKKEIADLRSGVFCPANHSTAMGRFSILAILSVGTLLITGLFSSWAQVTVLPALATPYSITLFTKLGLVIPLVILGTVNLLRVIPRLARDGKALQLLYKTVTAQAVIAVMVLLAVATLVNMEPARQAVSGRQVTESGKLVLQSTVEGVNVKVIVEPGTLGPNLVTVFLTDQSGRPVPNAAAVTLRLTYLDRDIESSAEPIIDHGSGIWIAHEALLNVEGRWQASLLIQRPGAFDTRTTFRFQVPISTDSTVIALSSETGGRLWGVELLLLGLLFGGVGLYAGGRKTLPGILASAGGGTAILAGVLMVTMSLPG